MDTSQGAKPLGDWLLGATLPGHAVEGGNYGSDWWHWEQRPGRIRGDATSQIAACHYERYAEDIALAARFGLNALLIGVEWSRIQPEEGQSDEDALGHYADVLACARKHGITPLVALHHVAAPQWFSARYGWWHRRAPELFEEYVVRAIGAFGERCRHWIPWHESTHWVVNAAFERRWPSGPRLAQIPRTLRNVKAAHTRAYTAIKGAIANAQVGYTIRVRRFSPYNPASVWDQRAADRVQRFCNRIPVPNSEIDFLGVGFYGEEDLDYSMRNPRQGFAKRPGNLPDEPDCRPDSEGFKNVLQEFSRKGKPLYVTGEGLATDVDAERVAHVEGCLNTVRQAREGGADIRGYFHHALLDGFEWTSGYDRRYGLIHVDRRSLARTPNKSAFALQKFAAAETAVRERKAAQT